jgi:phosphopantothenoylcysteine decarboxylase/phosphopantothenate--cysteine ligase
MQAHRVLLIIGGGIAAYKTPDLVRALRKDGFQVRCLLTAAAEQFVSPLSLASVSGDKVYENLFDMTDEAEMGHIQLSRDADIVLVAPATADLIAKMAQGTANDLASTALLATDKPVYIAPAMNVRMWHHAATQRNITQLKSDGITLIGPEEGDMACGEYGLGRMAEPTQIAAAIKASIDMAQNRGGLAGRHILVTAGPTHEPIDPVRYIANRSSGKQGYAIAEALANAGAHVTLISGPTQLSAPRGVNTIAVETAQEMMQAVEASLPADAAIMCAAVADWRVADASEQKIKKEKGVDGATLSLVENPDILAWLCQEAKQRPPLVIGFAAETENVVAHATAKRARKQCDWLIANDVSPNSEVMGGDFNTVHLMTAEGHEDWVRMSKAEVAVALAQRISETLGAQRGS